MKKLTYWVSPSIHDSSAYNIRAKTRKECNRLISEWGSEDTHGRPVKHTIEYVGVFDLMEHCLADSLGYEPMGIDTIKVEMANAL